MRLNNVTFVTTKYVKFIFHIFSYIHSIYSERNIKKAIGF